MRLFTLFISYHGGTHYCGVYPRLESLYDVIREMAADEDIDYIEIPEIGEIRQDVEGTLDYFEHQFQNGTWIHIQETSEQLVKVILDEFFEKLYSDLAARIASLPKSKEAERAK